MTDRRARFNTTARTARSIGDEAETGLANELAAEIRRDLASFDPKRLRGLGPNGIKILLGTLDAPIEPANEPVSKVAHEHESSVTGWAHLRRPESGLWLDDVVLGTLAGLAIVAIGGVLSIYLG